MIRRGSIIDNKYEILKEIGRGGMSTVYLAMDNRLNKQWAIKEISKVTNDKNSEVVVQSLIIEANLMKRLDHPALPRIVDIIDDGDSILVVMDYIEGESLNNILDSSGAQPQEVVIEWAKQLCDVLRYLHSQTPPIIYRDMKPANVILKPEGTLKVIDFGIAREFKEHNITDTVSLGTKGYAAPEQFGGKGQTDARTDIYCLGVTLYHLVTGQNPCEPPYEIYPIRQWNTALSSGFEAIIQKCTQMNPNDRYQSCDELMYALEHYNELDDTYRKKQKKKIKLFSITAIASIVFFVISFVSNLLYVNENDKNYDKKIQISSSTSYEEKISTYIEAINLYPYRPDAFIKLLNAYSDNNKFTDVESNQFMKYYNDSFNNNEKGVVYDNDYADMNYTAGVMYLYLYNIDDENVSLKVRALKAYPFFEEIVNNNISSYENYDIANAYYVLCDFFSNYVANSTNTKEPSFEVYNKLVDSINISLSNLNSYQDENSPFIKLSVYEAISDLIYSQRKGFAATKVEADKVYNVMNAIFENTKSMYVTQEKSINKQNYILKNIEGYIAEIKSTYGNMEE